LPLTTLLGSTDLTDVSYIMHAYFFAWHFWIYNITIKS